MLNVQIDTVRDFEKFVLRDINEFKKLGFVFTSYKQWETNYCQQSKELLGKSKQEKESLYKQHIIYEYSNLRERLIPIRPREIVYSKNFIINPKYKEGLKSLERKIQNGEDLTTHLSRKIFQADFSDGLLFDFGIYHLHLGILPDKNHPKLVQGYKDVLYAVFTDDKAFFIRIDDHRNWANLDLLKIVQQEFPQILEKWELQGILSMSSYPTEKERLELRKAGINAPIAINGKYYISPGGGMNTAKTSSNGVLKMNTHYHFYEKIDSQIKQFFDKYNQEIQEKTNLHGNLTFQMSNISPMEFVDKKNKIRLIPKIQNDHLIEINLQSFA